MSTQHNEHDMNIKREKAPPSKGPPIGKLRKPAIILGLFLIFLFLGLIILKFTLQSLVAAEIKKAVTGTAHIGNINIGINQATIEEVQLKSREGETWISLEKGEIRYNIADVLRKPLGHKAVKSVDIYGPSVLLKYGDDGRLNIYDLFRERPKKEPRPLEIEAVIRIHDGEFTFGDPRYQDFSQTAHSINGAISIKGQEGVFIDRLSAGIQGTSAVLSARGRLPADLGSGSFHIRGKDIQISPWVNYIVQSDQVDVEDGVADITANLSSPDFSAGESLSQSLELQVEGNLRRGKIQLAFLPDPIEDLKGDIGATLDLVRISKMAGSYNNAPLELSGKIFNFGPHTTLQLHLELPRIALEDMSKQPAIKSSPFELKGNVSASVGVEGTLLSPLIQANMDFDRIHLEGQPVDQGQIKLIYHAGVIHYDLLKARWKQGGFSGRGYINIEGNRPYFLLEMAGKDADVGQLAGLAFPDYHIEATSNFDVKILGTTDNHIIMGHSDFSRLSYDKYRLDRGSGRFLLAGGDLFLFDMEGSSGEGAISSPRGYVDIKGKNLDFVVDAQGLDLSTVYSGEIPAEGTRGNLSTRILGTVDSPIFLGNFNEGSFSFNQEEFTKTAGSFIYGRDILYLRDIRGLLRDAPLGLSGWFSLKDEPAGEVVFEARNFLTGYLSAFAPGLKSLESRHRMDLSGFAGGSLKDLGWGFTGRGELGNLAGFGHARNGLEDLQGALLGWRLDLDDLMPKSLEKSISPGRGSGALLLSGKQGRLKTHFLLNTPRGTALGLPISRSRGALSMEGSILSLEDVHIEGSANSNSVSDRWRLTADMYQLSTYWGIDSHDQRRTSLLARMYYAPFIYQDFKYTRDGWKLDVLGPVFLQGSNPLKGDFSRISGLPAIWGTPGYYQLKPTGAADGPLSITVDNIGRRRRTRDRVRVYDASVSGTINTGTGGMDLLVDSGGLNLGIVGRNLDLDSLGVDLSQLKKIISLDSVEGDATLSGKLTGSLSDPIWKGRVQIANGLMNNEFFSLDSSFLAQGSGIHIDDLELIQAMGSYQGAGNIDFKPGISFDLNLKARGGKLSRILAFTPWRDIGARGRVSGDIQLQGTPERPVINGDLSVEGGQVFNQPFSRLSMTFKSEPDSIALEKLTANIGQGQVQGSGRMLRNDMDFEFSTVDFPISGIQFLRDSFSGISGTGDLNLNLSGTRNRPILNLDVDARDMTVRGNHFERMGGAVRWEGHNLRFNDLYLQADGSRWDLEGCIDFAKGPIPTRWDNWVSDETYPRFNITSTMKDWSIATILDLTDHPLRSRLEGTLNGSLKMSGPLSDPALSMDLAATQGRIGQDPFDQINADVEFEKNRISLNRLSFKAGDASVQAEGRYDEKDQQLRLRAEIDDFPTRMIGVFIPRARKFSGLIDANLKMWGDPSKPDIEATVFVNDGKYGQFEFDQAGGEIQAQEGVFTFNDLAVRKGKHRIGFAGVIPVAISEGRLENTAPMKITADIRENSLDIFGLIIPFIEKTTGTIRGNLEVSGQYPDLEMEGSARIRNGSVKLSMLNNEITGLKADVEFNGKKLLLETFEGIMGEGKFNVDGYASIDSSKFHVDDMRFGLTGNNLTVQMPGLIRGNVATRVTLSGSQDQMVVGRLPDEEEDNFLRISNATFTMPEGQLKDLSQIIPGRNKEEKSDLQQEDEFSFPMPVVNPFTLTLGNDVWLDHKGLFIQSGGSLLLVRRPTESLRIFGELAFQKGTLQIPFFTNTFKVTNGIAYFHGGDPVKDDKTGETVDYSMNPYFEMNAETTVSDVEVFLSYTGDLDELQEALKPGSTVRADLAMHSIPSMSRNDIMRLLISGTVLGGITESSPGDASTGSHVGIEGAAVSALSSFILSPLTRQFGRALALSDLSFQYSPVGSFSFRVSKAIDSKERFFITYSQYVPPQGSQYDMWGIEYKYRPGMRVRVESVQDTFIYSLLGRIEFDSFPEFLRELFKATSFWGRKK